MSRPDWSPELKGSVDTLVFCGFGMPVLGRQKKGLAGNAEERAYQREEARKEEPLKPPPRPPASDRDRHAGADRGGSTSRKGGM